MRGQPTPGGSALGGVILSLADVRAAFLAGGLLTVAACTVLLVGVHGIARHCARKLLGRVPV